MNSSMWLVSSHVKEEESTVHAQWTEDLRSQMQCEETEKQKKSIQQKVKMSYIMSNK